ncbi:High-affnity carbon uptake protein Hat/HatR [hydrothermal vent metagenome]|uniref:High-affnity carbon uptake protein Hat/HatR n=1 Tax=hydrothermal vent metagenome TaxID=652676 RepID=A0A3B1DYI5_9ZZZZ
MLLRKHFFLMIFFVAAFVAFPLSTQLSAQDGVQQNSVEKISKEIGVIEFELPTGSTVIVDGENQGTKRTFKFPALSPKNNVEHIHNFVIKTPSGKISKHQLSPWGGQRLRLIKTKPVSPSPKFLPRSGHRDSINSVAFSSDGKQIITKSLGTTIIWENPFRKVK